MIVSMKAGGGTIVSKICRDVNLVELLLPMIAFK